MNDESNIQAEQIVDRAVGALRDAPIPPGPPPETLQAVLAAGGAVAQRIKHKTITQRIFTMNRLPRIAAAIVILAGIAGLVWVLAGPGAVTIAWADVQQHIRNAQTMTLKGAMEMEGLPKWMEKAGLTNMEMTMMFKAPGLMRQEMTMGRSKVITIMDIQQSKMITLVEAQKKATIIDLTELPAEIRKKQAEQDYLGGIKKLIEESETELGEKEIDGRAAKGYRVEKDNQVFTVWADAETGRPVEMNMTAFQAEAKVTMSDFKFDVELDESLFNLDVPEGYTVEKKQLGFKEASADDLVEMLRIWTKVRGGTFPDALTPSHLMKDTMSFVKAGKDDKLENQKVMKEFEKADGRKTSVVIARATMLVAQHSEAHYAGKGVKLGDAKTAIFWYRPKDSGTYKVIYGDLSIKDVAEEDLPPQADQAEPDAPAGTD